MQRTKIQGSLLPTALQHFRWMVVNWLTDPCAMFRVFFFLWRFDPIPGYRASRSHWLDTPHSVGLLWTSYQLVTETSVWQHTTLTRDRHPCLRWDLNPQSQQARGRRYTPLTARPPGSAYVSCKGKAVPLQAWSGPEGARKLRFPNFMTAQDGGKVVSLTHRPPLPPGNTPGIHFC